VAQRVPSIVDFETHAIGRRPKYPPEPVGVAIALPGRKARYLAWGHPVGNNCTEEQAQARAQVGEALRQPGGQCLPQR
jgi:hypothetical protein